MYVFIISIRLTQLVFLDTKLEMQANLQNQLICPIFLVGAGTFFSRIAFPFFYSAYHFL